MSDKPAGKFSRPLTFEADGTDCDNLLPRLSATGEWTTEYVEKLELNYGWEGVAHKHNAALAAENERVTHILTLKMAEYMREVEQLREQLAAERNKTEAWGKRLKGADREIERLQQQLAAEQNAFAAQNPTSFVRIEKVQELLAAERGKVQELRRVLKAYDAIWNNLPKDQLVEIANQFPAEYLKVKEAK